MSESRCFDKAENDLDSFSEVLVGLLRPYYAIVLHRVAIVRSSLDLHRLYYGGIELTSVQESCKAA